MSNHVTMDKIAALCKTRGIIFPGSEIYGGLANSWDYGPLGTELLNNIKQAWWKKFIIQSPYNVGLDSSVLLNPKVWEASGHVGGFSDPLIDCKHCKSRFRADHLIESHYQGDEPVDSWSDQQIEDYIKQHALPCTQCGKSDFTSIRKFNLMFKTNQGVIEESTTALYLRPETAQGIFINFRAVQRSMRKKIPFGIGQVGKAFRNEITPGNFIFRTREFEQMELEFFCKPGEDLTWFNYWKNYCMDWLLSLGIKKDHLAFRDHQPEELSHYSNATTDIEFLFPFGWGELWGIADRTDFDLKAHMNHAGQDLSYTDPYTNEKYIPYVIEPSLGLNRVALAFLSDAYDEEKLADGSTRNVLRLHPALSPYKVAVLPLVKKLSDQALVVFETLSQEVACDFDESGAIGKRYRRHDEIGTPMCITFDFDSLEDQSVTIRDRDTMEQVRIPIEQLTSYVKERVAF